MELEHEKEQIHSETGGLNASILPALYFVHICCKYALAEKKIAAASQRFIEFYTAGMQRCHSNFFVAAHSQDAMEALQGQGMDGLRFRM